MGVTSLGGTSYFTVSSCEDPHLEITIYFKLSYLRGAPPPPGVNSSPIIIPVAIPLWPPPESFQLFLCLFVQLCHLGSHWELITSYSYCDSYRVPHGELPAIHVAIFMVVHGAPL